MRAKEGPQAASLPVVIGSGSHPFPFRTRKLSLIPPMVLHGKLCGRVGRCRHYSSESPRGFDLAGFRLYATAYWTTQFPVRCMTLFAGAPRTLGPRVWESRSRLRGFAATA